MSQHDYNIANANGAAARADINLALPALASMSSGAGAPATTYGDMLWYETDTQILWKRDTANTAWVPLLQLTASGVQGFASEPPSVSASNALNSLPAGKIRVRVATANVATVGGPTGASAGVVDQEYFGASNIVQVYSHVTGTPRQWVRVFTSSWTPWREIYNAQSAIGTVSMSSGVPAGGLIERGSNANGEFTRMADGTMQCWFSATETTDMSTAVGQLFQRATAISLTFPSTFSAAPVVIPSAARVSGGFLIYASVDTQPTTTGFSLMLSGPQALSTAVTKRYSYFATGRWD